LTDPLVPLDLGGWLNRVFGVMVRDWRRNAAFGAIPAGVYAVGTVAMIATVPNEATMKQRIASAAEKAGGEIDRSAVLWQAFAPFAAVTLVFAVVAYLVIALYLPGVFYLAIRSANGQPRSVAQALAFARPRMLPLVGWYLLINLVAAVTLGIALLPGLLSGVGVLIAVGVAVILPVLFVFTVVFGGTMLGVVVLERDGPARAFALLRRRFWSTTGRMVVASVLYMCWGVLMNIAMLPFDAGMESGSLGFSSVLGALIQSVLVVPALMFVAAVGLVTYAELRHREDRSVNTGTLAAQLTH
jgi:hypothetical protein